MKRSTRRRLEREAIVAAATPRIEADLSPAERAELDRAVLAELMAQPSLNVLGSRAGYKDFE